MSVHGVRAASGAGRGRVRSLLLGALGTVLLLLLQAGQGCRVVQHVRGVLTLLLSVLGTVLLQIRQRIGMVQQVLVLCLLLLLHGA